MTEEQIKMWNAALEKAAEIAAPAYQSHRAEGTGRWANRRGRIASEIRACKVPFQGAQE